MDEFKVKLQQIQDVSAQQKMMIQELTSICNELHQIKNDLRFKIAQRNQIDVQLQKAETAIERQGIHMKQLAQCLTEIQQLYERTERTLSGLDEGLGFMSVISAGYTPPMYKTKPLSKEAIEKLRNIFKAHQDNHSITARIYHPKTATWTTIGPNDSAAGGDNDGETTR